MLLALSGEDPAQGVVLGGLYGDERAAGPGCLRGGGAPLHPAHPGGLKLRFNDESQTLRIEDQPGSYLQCRPHVVRLHSETALEIEAPGKAIVIRGRHHRFPEEGLNALGDSSTR